MKLLLLSHEESSLRLSKVKSAMRLAGINSILLCDNANIYYLTGRVFDGYIYITLDIDSPAYLVRRPIGLEDATLAYIHKIENLPEAIASAIGTHPDSHTALELDTVAYSAIARIGKALHIDEYNNASTVMRTARSVKTPFEIEQIRRSGDLQALVYKKIPQLFTEGMSDIELQIAIENLSRQKGCLGQFRISGADMELFMGNILAGDNADAPSPYDFAMGGAGQDPSLPVGANGTILHPGITVMVDINGNYTGYMTDMTRTFRIGNISEKAMHAHEVSIEICHELAKMGIPGTPAKELYERAVAIADEHGLKHYFMGHRQQAGFVGHGLGIEINELPVIAPRSRNILEPGQVIALEPKFVIPGTGPVGIENTYVVTNEGMQQITYCPEQIIDLQ